MMKMSEFKYDLPDEKIAKYPPIERGNAKLLVLDRGDGSITHRKYPHILEYLKPGDVLVLNETKVEKRRTYFLTEKKKRLEILFLNRIGDGRWYVLIKGAKYVKPDDILVSEEDEDIKIEVDQRSNEGFLVKPLANSERIFEKIGHTPIPPYMKRGDTEEDYLRYNTVFARLEGSVASPTASLNMTQDFLQAMERRGIKVVKVELKVGWGTFAPVREENIEEHKIHTEEITVSKEVAESINSAKKEGNDIWAVGTTVARTLESCTNEDGNVYEYSGNTSLYIYPGYRWKVVDHLITNFHMPDSSLILLVSSFAGKDFIRNAYDEALKNDYKFLSYGDSMLII